MTKDEFIDKYMADSKLKPEYRTRDGFTIPDDEPRIAEPCDCGDPICTSWQMTIKPLVINGRSLNYSDAQPSELLEVNGCMASNTFYDDFKRHDYAQTPKPLSPWLEMKPFDARAWFEIRCKCGSIWRSDRDAKTISSPVECSGCGCALLARY